MDEVMKINIEKLKETRNENKANYEDRIRKEAIKVANNIIKQVCNDFASYTEKQNYTTVKVRIDKDEDAIKHAGRVNGTAWAFHEFHKVGWVTKNDGVYVDSNGKYSLLTVYFEE